MKNNKTSIIFIILTIILTTMVTAELTHTELMNEQNFFFKLQKSIENSQNNLFSISVPIIADKGVVTVTTLRSGRIDINNPTSDLEIQKTRKDIVCNYDACAVYFYAYPSKQIIGSQVGFLATSPTKLLRGNKVLAYKNPPTPFYYEIYGDNFGETKRCSDYQYRECVDGSKYGQTKGVNVRELRRYCYTGAFDSKEEFSFKADSTCTVPFGNTRCPVSCIETGTCLKDGDTKVLACVESSCVTGLKYEKNNKAYCDNKVKTVVVIEEKPVCPNGYANNGGVCMPTDMYLICAEKKLAFNKDKNACEIPDFEPDEPDKETDEPDKEIKCPDGFKQEENLCFATTELIKCGDDASYIIDNNVCKKVQQTYNYVFIIGLTFLFLIGLFLIWRKQK